MFGAIVGDIAGSAYERANFRFETCEIFAKGSQYTDDTVLTLATADHFIFGDSYAHNYRQFGRNYPRAGYGGSFIKWMTSDNPQPYESWGNGSAMRVSPVGWVAENLDWALSEAERSAEVTHNHPNGIKGAQAISSSIFLSRQGESKESIRNFVTDRFGYDLESTVEDLRKTHIFDMSCEGTVPVAIVAFLESYDFESSIRKAISIGGDSDTIACMTGSISHAFYREIPKWMSDYCFSLLDPVQQSIITDFWKKFPSK